jgi:hypothetical protein
VAVGALLLLGALAVTAIPGQASGSLDPASSHHDGSKAIAEVLRGYGVAVRAARSLDDLAGAVVVTVPQAWSGDQLRRIAAAARRVVLVAPSQRELDALGSGVQIAGATAGPTAPDCTWPGAAAAGPVDLPLPTLQFAATRRGQTCYRGAVALAGSIAAVGSPALLRNDTVGRAGVAALDVNLLTADRTIAAVTWLLPGTAGAGTAAAATVWDLFPAGVHRAVVWLIAVAVLLAIVCARRFGPVVREPLPVVVRAAELVEGHGRLYARARARDRAAAALRDGTVRRLRSALGLPRSATAAAVVAAVAATTGRHEAAVAELLDGPAPADDEALLRLARGLADMEGDAGSAVTVPRPRGARL